MIIMLVAILLTGILLSFAYLLTAFLDDAPEPELPFPSLPPGRPVERAPSSRLLLGAGGLVEDGVLASHLGSSTARVLRN